MYEKSVQIVVKGFNAVMKIIREW